MEKVSIDKVAVSGVDACTFYSDMVDEDTIDEKIVYISDSDKNSKGKLMVNRSDIGLRVYSSAKYPTNLGNLFSQPIVQATILPKNAMYVLLDSNKGNLDIIKYLDQDGVIEYGYIMKSYGYMHDQNKMPEEWKENIEIYGLQRNFGNYNVSEDGNDLVYSTRVSINGASCIIYRLRYAAKVYNSSFELRDTIPAGTKIAITGSSTGEHHNEVMPIRQRQFDG